MNEQIFRKKSLDKVKSPESLNDYVQVSNPSVWLLLAAIIVLLAGACIWGVLGNIETTVDCSVVAENGVVTGFIADAQIEPGMLMRIGDAEYEIENAEFSSNTGRLMCTVTAKANIPDGTYNAAIITERIKPISFILS